MMCNCTVSGIYESIPLEWLEIVFKIYEISYFLGKPACGPLDPIPQAFLDYFSKTVEEVDISVYAYVNQYFFFSSNL